MRVLEVICRWELECSAQVGLWNYWDAEHIKSIHPGYGDVSILYETKDIVVMLPTVSLPILSFITSTSIHVMLRHDQNTLLLYNMGLFGTPIHAILSVTEPRKDHAVFKMTYRYHLKGWRIIMAPLLKIMTPIWNRKIWFEDLPIKERRQKVMRMNFKNFKGLPDKIEDRFYDGDLPFDIPLPRLKGSGVDQHPFSFKNPDYKQ